MARQIQESDGWRIGWNPEAETYCGLVAGQDWSLELTEPEIDDLCRLSAQLATEIAQLAAELMDEERIACEAETEHIWVEVEGFPNNYDLRFILFQGRGAEATWPAAVVPSVQQALQRLKVF